MNRFVFDSQPEEQLFRPAPDGWIFTIGSGWSYAVNDAQKAELLGCLKRWRFVGALLMMTTIGVVLLAAGGSWLFVFPDWMHLAVFATGALAATFLVMKFVIPRLRYVIVRPLLAGLTPLSAAPAPPRVGMGESMRAEVGRQAQIYSIRYLVITVVVFAGFSIKESYDALMANGSIFALTGSVFLTLYFIAILVMKLKRKRSRS
jgi:hypothetical protein